MFYNNLKQITGDNRFKEIAKHLSSNFEIHPTIDFAKNKAKLDNQLTDMYNINISPAYDSLWKDFIIRTNEEEVIKLIYSIKYNKNPGPMRLHPRILKEGGPNIVTSITNILNAALESSIIPTEWKKSFMVPIPKQGNPEDIKNYKGIAIQSVISKVLDKLITIKLFEAIQPALDVNQHGFCKKKGTITNLINLQKWHGILKPIEKQWM